jgi:WD40 repeat protein
MQLVTSYEQTIYLVVKEVILGFNSKIQSEKNNRIVEFKTDLSNGAQILGLTTNRNGTELYAIFDNKLIVAWNTNTQEILGSRFLKKRPTSLVSLTIHPDTENSKSTVVIADKFGDIIAIRTPDLSKEVLLGGHTASVVTDLVTTKNQDLLLTSDRDEKIRISSFPAVETIQSYALGHQSVVSSVTTITNEHNEVFVVSSGWDHQILLWKYAPGTMSPIHSYSCTSRPTSSTGKPHLQLSMQYVYSHLYYTLLEETMEQVDEEQQGEEEVTAEEGDNNNETNDNNDNNDNNDDMPKEKQYVEADAGHYPFKVISNPQGNFIVVLFKDELLMKVLTIENEQLLEVNTITTDQPVADIHFLSNDHLLILSPNPKTITVYDISNSNNVNDITQTILDNDILSIIKERVSTVTDFTQKLVAETSGFDGDSGMRFYIVTTIIMPLVICYMFIFTI